MATFAEAFKAARKAGKKTFTWKGKSYTTRLKGESKSVWLKRIKKASLASLAPKTSPRPKPRASAKNPKRPVPLGYPSEKARRKNAARVRASIKRRKRNRTAKGQLQNSFGFVF